jgi:hypothetical protein
VATIVCNINAISAAERSRHGELITRLRGAIQNRRELPDGYSYDLDAGKVTLQEVAEWITAERRCCPFLSFELAVKDDGSTRLTLEGPVGTKDILRRAFTEILS